MNATLDQTIVDQIGHAIRMGRETLRISPNCPEVRALLSGTLDLSSFEVGTTIPVTVFRTYVPGHQNSQPQTVALDVTVQTTIGIHRYVRRLVIGY